MYLQKECKQMRIPSSALTSLKNEYKHLYAVSEDQQKLVSNIEAQSGGQIMR